MPPRFLSFLLFHLRRMAATQTWWVVAAVASLGLLIAVVSAWSWQWNQLRSLQAEAFEFQSRISQRKLENAEIAKKIQAPVSLPAFRNAVFLTALHHSAAKTKLDLNELSYVLDEAPGLPYLRYRIQFSVVTSYPSVRRFVKDLQSELPNVSLESISCSREDIGALDLHCDLNLSAFFERGDRG